MPVRIQKGRALSNLSLTPLIDVVFLLLIFFLVATRFEEEERSHKVKLPEAAEAMPLTVRPKELFVNVDKDGRFIVSQKELNAQQLFDVLKQASETNPGRQTVIIRADGRCTFQPVVTVMDLCNKAGIREYTVATAEPGA